MFFAANFSSYIPRNLNCRISGIISSIILSFFIFNVSKLQAQSGSRPVPGKKLTNSSTSNLTTAPGMNFSSTLDNIITDSSNPNYYDAETISVLDALHEVTQPIWNPYDYDEQDAKRATEKAFTIQAGRHGSYLIKGSELKPTYQYLKRGLNTVKEKFRYSIQEDPDSLTVSKGSKGRKLLELNLEFNLAQGLDPQIKIFDSVRFRYDLIEKRQLFEYAFNF